MSLHQLHQSILRNFICYIKTSMVYGGGCSCVLMGTGKNGGKQRNTKNNEQKTIEGTQTVKCKPWTERVEEKRLSRGVSRAASKRRINRELEAEKAHKPWIREGRLPWCANREVGTFQPRKFQCFRSQFALHGLRALETSAKNKKKRWGKFLQSHLHQLPEVGAQPNQPWSRVCNAMWLRGCRWTISTKISLLRLRASLSLERQGLGLRSLVAPSAGWMLHYLCDTPLFRDRTPQRAQRSKKIEISIEIENFDREWNFRASHPPRPYFSGEIETSRLKFSSEIKNFDQDWKFRSRSIFFDRWALGGLLRLSKARKPSSLVAPYRAILRYYRCDTPYRAILFKGGEHSPRWCDTPLGT